MPQVLYTPERRNCNLSIVCFNLLFSYLAETTFDPSNSWPSFPIGKRPVRIYSSFLAPLDVKLDIELKTILFRRIDGINTPADNHISVFLVWGGRRVFLIVGTDTGLHLSVKGYFFPLVNCQLVLNRSNKKCFMFTSTTASSTTKSALTVFSSSVFLGIVTWFGCVMQRPPSCVGGKHKTSWFR